MQVKMHSSVLSFPTTLCISLLAALAESCYLKLDIVSSLGTSIMPFRDYCDKMPGAAASRTESNTRLLAHLSVSQIDFSLTPRSRISSTLLVSALLTPGRGEPADFPSSLSTSQPLTHHPEVVMLFLERVGSARSDSAVSCKQTSLIGLCYS